MDANARRDDIVSSEERGQDECEEDEAALTVLY